MGPVTQAFQLLFWASAPGVKPGLLRSGTTRRPGFVQLVDTKDSTLWTSGQTPSAEAHLTLPDESPFVTTVGNYRVAQQRFDARMRELEADAKDGARAR